MKDKDFFPVVLVANKCDLEYERQVGGHGKSSSDFAQFILHWLRNLLAEHVYLSFYLCAEGRELAKHFGCRFIETSAKQRLNVDESFSNLVREIRKYNKVSFSTTSLLFIRAFLLSFLSPAPFI